jgi:hypothetical protein
MMGHAFSALHWCCGLWRIADSGQPTGSKFNITAQPNAFKAVELITD